MLGPPTIVGEMGSGSPIAQRLNAEHADYRAGLVMSQIVGLTPARHIVGLEALTSYPRERLAADLGATFHHYLLGDLAGEPQPETKEDTP